MQFMDDPIGDFSIFPTYLVSQLARKHVTVALSGDGGDELFGGYETFLAEQKLAGMAAHTGVAAKRRHRARDRRVAADRREEGARQQGQALRGGRAPRSRHGVTRAGGSSATRRAQRSLLTPAARRACAHRVGAHIVALREEAAASGRPRQARSTSTSAATWSTTASPRSIACRWRARSRRACRCSIKEVVELAFRLPSRLKFDGSQTKILLKRVAARHVPRECVYRPKEGFSIPIKNWLKEELRPMAEQYLAPKRIERDGLFEPRGRGRLWHEHLDNRANHSHLLWALLVFQQWRDRLGSRDDRARPVDARPTKSSISSSSAAEFTAPRCCAKPHVAACRLASARRKTSAARRAKTRCAFCMAVCGTCRPWTCGGSSSPSRARRCRSAAFPAPRAAAAVSHAAIRPGTQASSRDARRALR